MAKDEPTREDIEALVGSATPHFAYQLRARVWDLIRDLPESSVVRGFGEEQMDALDRLGHASSRAEEGPRESADRPGWDSLPSHAPASHPLPHRTESS